MIDVTFDMDGTIPNLYGSENWEFNLRNENAGVFRNLPFLPEIDIPRFYAIIQKLLQCGVKFNIITWLPMQASPEYEEVCRQEKLEWVKEYLPFITNFTALSYGIPKQNGIVKRAQKMFLIDDNIEVCKVWQTVKQREALTVTKDWTVIDALEEIYTRYCAE